jgi:hypothetical protein
MRYIHKEKTLNNHRCEKSKHIIWIILLQFVYINWMQKSNEQLTYFLKKLFLIFAKKFLSCKAPEASIRLLRALLMQTILKKSDQQWSLHKFP